MGSVSILGTRGIPARHGGFETFAAVLAPYLQGQGWQVTVYCQADPGTPSSVADWMGIHLVTLPVRLVGPLGTMEFDLKCILHALRHPSDINLTLGYNTAFFGVLLRLWGRFNLINMDGLEWKRSKWPAPVRVWFYLNEWLGCWLGNRLVADHPEIARHLHTRGVARKVVMIPYGAELVQDVATSVPITFGLVPGRYLLIVARPEPENSLLELVRAFSTRYRGIKLVVLGTYAPESNAYHAMVLAAASDEVLFLGAIYDQATVAALRYHSLAYCHGHRVGGTNPSLVEALGAGCAVLAHDNPFNRWVAGAAAMYFSNEDECAQAMETMLKDPAGVGHLRAASRQRHADSFTWPAVLQAYDALLTSACGVPVSDCVSAWSGADEQSQGKHN